MDNNSQQEPPIPLTSQGNARIEEIIEEPDQAEQPPLEGESVEQSKQAPVQTTQEPIEMPEISESSWPIRVPPSKQITNYRALHNPQSQTVPNWWDTDLPEEDMTALISKDQERSEPSTVMEVQKCNDWPEWQQAMLEELSTLQAKETFLKTVLPEGRKAIDSKWVFKIKRNQDGSIAKYKARLVAKGFSQIPGIDYEYTQAPSLRLESLRVVLALAAFLNLELHGIDVKGAYLNRHLDKEIYMKQPPSFQDGTNNVLKLIKSLYGLKQSGRAWRTELHKALTAEHFSRLNSDHSIYIQTLNSGIVIIAIHIDDMVIAASNLKLSNQMKKAIASHFEITDLGELTSMVGLEIKRD